MYKGRNALLMLIVAMLAMVSVAVVSPAVSDDSSAEASYIGTNDIKIIVPPSRIAINADSYYEMEYHIVNKTSSDRIVHVYANCDNPKVNIKINTPTLTIEPEKFTKISLTISADKLAHQGEYTFNVNYDVRDTNDDVQVGSSTFDLIVHSSLSSSDQYNRFMGIWDNNMTGILGDAWFAALVTGAIWIGIGFAVGIIAVPLVLRIIFKKKDEEYELFKRSLIRMCLIIIFLNGIGKAIRVLGVDEGYIDFVNVIFYICYILVGAVVAWRVYLLIIDFIVKRIKARDYIPGSSRSDFESLKPLFVYIGEIFFTCITVGMIMNLLGFNMTAIITSAGIISLGITMGAQSVLSQFFSGLVILATRPFKAGDYITLNGGTITYRVKKINVMYTEFENWDNTDITIIPNSSLTSGVVKNITRETLKSKVHVFMEVAYGTDLAYARAAMLEVANANPRVIKDGSVSRPSTRVTQFNDSNIELRLSVYVDDFNDSGVIGGELRQALYNKFNEKGIRIDYPQVVIHNAESENDENR